MSLTSTPTAKRPYPAPAAVLELLKPVTWFAPMWAFVCGAISSGRSFSDQWGLLLVGMILAGPLVCAASQATNDWYDRHVDAINEPNRPIPSGRIPGNWGLVIAIFWSGLSLVVGASLGIWAFGATVVGVILAWAYSAPPLRLKLNGWYGNAAVGISYEGLAWFTGAAVLLTALPSVQIIALAVLYSVGAHGIMTLNDFKAIEGDQRLGIRTLPVQLGPDRAGWVACIVMIVPQIVVAGLLLAWGKALFAAVILGLVIGQTLLMRRLLRDPEKYAPWYNATGILLYVLGMMVSAFAIRDLGAL